MRYASTSVVALTSGDWVVVDEGLWVDADLGLVYFTALRETPLEKHLYVVSIHHPGHVRLLTQTGFSYKIEINSVSTGKSCFSFIMLLNNTYNVSVKKSSVADFGYF